MKPISCPSFQITLLAAALPLMWSSSALADRPANAGAETAGPALDREFITPPREARPYTYWMWLGTVAPPEVITRDLEEFYDKGIVGVLIYPSSLGPVWYPKHKVVLEGKEYRRVAGC